MIVCMPTSSAAATAAAAAASVVVFCCRSIKPLFANKPLLIVVNKTDVRPVDSLTADEQQLLAHMEAEARRISSGGEGWGGKCLRVRAHHPASEQVAGLKRAAAAVVRSQQQLHFTRM
jgi:hypothetical protein